MYKILVVDDEPKIREVIREYAEFSGYEVVEAEDGMSAIGLCKLNDYDLIIMDVMMPKLDGFSACKEIKKIKDVPVIMLSARGEEYDKLFGFELGVDDYIVKPFQISLLKARIRNLLSLREKMKTMYGETFSLKQFGVEEPKEHDDFLTRYIEIVKANISNPELDVSVIYEALGMSRTNFYRKVKTVTGLSPIELIKNIRLEAGAKLLKESDMNVSEIAQHIGFSSRSYFARSFKAVYGMSPTEYQETESQN